MRELPHSPNLRHLRRQARELQRQTGEPLQAAQHRIARCYGLASWSQLKSMIEAGRIVAEWQQQPFGKRVFEARRDAGLTPTAAEIVSALEHPNPRVRCDCLAMLDHLADESSVVAMIAATSDPVPRVRRMAVHALGCQRCKPSALSSDLNAIFVPIAEGDPAWRVRREAVISIVQQPADECSGAVLARLADHDPHALVRQQAAWALRIQTGRGSSYGHRTARRG